MRMASLIDVEWVAPLLPKLKNPVDIDKLSGLKPKILKGQEETKSTP